MRLSGPGWAVAVAVVLTLLSAGSAWGHAGAAPLTFWGEFPRTTARCQRTIGHAAALCPLRALHVRSSCRLREFGDEPCAPTYVNDEVQRARAHARRLVSNRCNAQQVQLLRYLDINEALTDVIGICRDMDNRVTALTFAPALQHADRLATEPEALACVHAASHAATRLLAVATDAHRRALDRIATKSNPFSRKLSLIAHGRARIHRAVQAAESAIVRQCPMETFQTLYGRSIAAHLALIVGEAECFGGAVYVQDAVVCPTPTPAAP